MARTKTISNTLYGVCIKGQKPINIFHLLHPCLYDHTAHSVLRPKESRYTRLTFEVWLQRNICTAYPIQVSKARSASASDQLLALGLPMTVCALSDAGSRDRQRGRPGLKAVLELMDMGDDFPTIYCDDVYFWANVVLGDVIWT